MAQNWHGLVWTPWVDFRDKGSFKLFPALPGVYRVRPAGGNELFYVGQTGRTLRERLQSLIRNALQEEMPFNDPHTAAPSLWAWKDAEKLEYEVSAAPSALPKREREGLECCLLWRYRLERGESTACNHGRFHPDYQKSRNRSSGFRGGRLAGGEKNPAGGESLRPLLLRGNPGEDEWMGLIWQAPRVLSVANARLAGPARGVYKIFNESKLLYIGQSTNLGSRLASHCKKHWGEGSVYFSYFVMPDETLPHQLKEYENDLIGAYYYQSGQVPGFQFAG